MSKNRGIFFVLGAGASVDSGLPTYRGPDGIYKDMIEPAKILNGTIVRREVSKIWNFLTPLYEQYKLVTPGPTYQKMKEIAERTTGHFILTQNIDQLIQFVGIPYVEVHGSFKYMKCMKCKRQYNTDIENLSCPECNIDCRPDIVLFGENLSNNATRYVCTMLNRNHFQYTVIIGTTMQFPYLKTFVDRAKQRGAKIIHINPDETYRDNVRKNEIWIKKYAEEGLQDFMDTYLLKNEIDIQQNFMITDPPKTSVPEPSPLQGKIYVFPALEAVLADSSVHGSKELLTLIRQRKQYGLNKYGTELMTHNGRNSFEDAYQELGDLAAYIMQAKLEDHSYEEFNELRQMFNVVSLVLDTEFKQ